MPRSPLPMHRTSPRRSGQRGYIMLVALIVMAILAILGVTTLRVAGIDQRVAIQNRKPFFFSHCFRHWYLKPVQHTESQR